MKIALMTPAQFIKGNKYSILFGGDPDKDIIQGEMSEWSSVTAHLTFTVNGKSKTLSGFDRDRKINVVVHE